MAIMIPGEVKAETTSSAERRLFEKLKADLTDQWMVFHSLGVARHASKQWAEIDFVVVGPLGIFCLEVKGGGVRREEGVWIGESRNGRHEMKDPIEQVKSAAYALRDYLRDSCPDLRHYVFGWGVLLPDVLFDIDGPEMVQEIVYDSRDLSHSFSRYVRRMAQYWQDDYERRWRKDARVLTEEERQAVKDALKGDFDLRPTLSAYVHGVETDMCTLTQEQVSVLKAIEDNARIMVRGGAGTGKTLLALEEANRHAQAGRNVLFVCYNRLLGQHIQQAVSRKGESRGEIWGGHFPQLMRQLVDEARLAHMVNVDVEESDLWDVYFPEAAALAVEQLGQREKYDVLVVDEAQDFGAMQVVVLDSLLRGGIERGKWTLFYDPFQIPFRTSADQVVNAFEAGAPVHCRLTVNCRNTDKIAWATEAMAQIYTAEDTRTSGKEVEWIFGRDEADSVKQMRAQLKTWIAGGIAPGEIMVLSPRKRENSIARHLQDLVQVLSPEERGNRGQRMRFAQVGAFKGMEAKAVLLCDVSNWGHEHTAFTLYVAMSRATSLLAVVLDASLELEWRERCAEQGLRFQRLHRSS